MYCSECGTEPIDGAAFCHACGVKVVVVADSWQHPSDGRAASASPPSDSSGAVMSSLPRWLHAHLMEQEIVIGRASVGELDYYATDRRLLVFRGKSSPDVVDYRHVSVRYHRYGRLFHFWRLFVGACGLAMFGFALVFTQHVKMDEATIGPRWEVAAVCVVLAILLLAMAIVSRYGYYRVTVREPTPEGAGNWHYRLERLRFAPRNEALDRLMHVLAGRKAASAASAGPQASESRQSRSRSPSFLATLAGVLSGAALLALYVVATDATPKLSTEGNTTFVSVDLLIIPVAVSCAVAAGFVGGFMSNWRGATIGGMAAAWIIAGLALWLLAKVMSQAPPAIQETPTGFTFNQLDPSFILNAVGPWALTFVAAIALGALAGRLGEHVRAAS